MPSTATAQPREADGSRGAGAAKRAVKSVNNIKMMLASVRWSINLMGATAIMPGFKPEATMIQPIAPCSPPSAAMPIAIMSSRPRNAPVRPNHTMPRPKTTPRKRPSWRWPHSHQKMNLNAAMSIPAFNNSYWGIARYFSNSICHASSVRGGMAPVTGRHSVMDRPEPVSRVAPPTITISTTKPIMTINQ